MVGCTGDTDFTHPVFNEAVRTIGGHYILLGEKRLVFNGREVLYLIGCAVADASCCAPGACAYALVPGYIQDWKYKTGRGGQRVSRVAPIMDRWIQDEIRRRIMEKEHVQQVNFEPL